MKVILLPIAMLTFLFATILSVTFSTISSAAEENEVRAPAAVNSAANGADSIQRKRYPGGADEDDLQVQATLPIPSRTLDGISSLNSASGGESDSDSAPPAND